MTCTDEAMAHCRLRSRPSPPFARRIRLIVRSLATMQYDAAKVLACAQRHTDVTRCEGIDVSPYGPLSENVTSSTKPEVHNISQRRRKRVEPRPQITRTKLLKIGRVVPEICLRAFRLQTVRNTEGRHRMQGRLRHINDGANAP